MFSALIEKLQRRQDLSMDEASQAMEEIMEGRAQPAQIAGLLIGLAMKGERPGDNVGAARARRVRVRGLRGGPRAPRADRRPAHRMVDEGRAACRDRRAGADDARARDTALAN